MFPARQDHGQERTEWCSVSPDIGSEPSQLAGMRFSCGRQPGCCCSPRRCRRFHRRRPQLVGDSDESLILCCLAMTRRCSHCGHNGHNARTCPNRGFRLFGVRLTDQPTTMRRSSSLSLSSPDQSESGDGSLSDGPVQTTSSAVSSYERERKKGVPWTEEEHRLFLIGLEKLGKGDWRGISREYVRSRTPTQVASHAQKHFIRQSNLSKRKRRSSLFDISTEQHQGNVDHQLSLRPPGRDSSLGSLPPPPPPRRRANKETAWLTLGTSSSAAAAAAATTTTNTGGARGSSSAASLLSSAAERALIRVL